MPRQLLEVADIFRRHGAAWRKTHQGHISLEQFKVMAAIERCRSVALGGHVLHCAQCDTTQIAYNSCRNRHCPKCQSSAAKRWLDARQKDLLPVEYYHVVFTLPADIASLAYHNKSSIYHILFKAAAETLRKIAKDPKHLGAHIGATMVLHTWGSTLTHHPHVHCIVPGGGFSNDGEQWVSCKPGFFLPVRVLSRMFRGLFLSKLKEAYKEKLLSFFGHHASLTESEVFLQWLKPLYKQEWVVYAKQPFAGPEAVLTYLSRYTHRVAISNSRLTHTDDDSVTFKYKDYRTKGRYRPKTMTLSADEFIRRFLLHTLPKGFHRIRHYGFFTNATRIGSVAKAREFFVDDTSVTTTLENKEEVPQATFICRACSTPMVIVSVFDRSHAPRGPPTMKRRLVL